MMITPQMARQNTPRTIAHKWSSYLLQVGRFFLVGHGAFRRMRPDLGVHPGSGNQSLPPSVGDQGDMKAEFFRIPDGMFLVQDTLASLIHGTDSPVREASSHFTGSRSR